MTKESMTELRRLVSEFEASTGRTTLLVCAGIDERLVNVVHRWLGSRQPAALDLVLCTRGGVFAPARKLAHILRRRSEFLRVYIPRAAHSAGTLLAVAADEILFGDLGELGPLDPQMSAAAPGAGGPRQVSAEDMRNFGAFAQEWFGVDPATEGMQLVGLLCQQVFPPTLTTAWRLDRAVVRATAELLDRQFPEATESEREAVARALVAAGRHDEGILPHDAQRLGLRARYAEDGEQAQLSVIVDLLDDVLDPAGTGKVDVVGVVAASDFDGVAVKAMADGSPVLRWQWSARDNGHEGSGQGP